MKKDKKNIITGLMLVCVALLIAGCQSGVQNTQTPEETARTMAEDKNSREEIQPEAELTEEKREAKRLLELAVVAIEQQYPEETFTDIPEEEAKEASVFSESYYFAGKKAAGGWEFIIGICHEKENPLEGMTCSAGGKNTGYNGSQFADGKILLLEKGDGERSRLSYLYDIFQKGEVGIRYLLEASERGVSLVPPLDGPFLKVSMIKEGIPVAEFLSLSPEQAAALENGVVLEEAERFRPEQIMLCQNREDLRVGQDGGAKNLTEEMVSFAKEKCRFDTGTIQLQDLTDITKATLMTNLHGEERSETTKNREDLEQLAFLLSKAFYENEVSEEYPYYGSYDGILALEMQDGTEAVVQISPSGTELVLGNASFYRLPKEEGEGLWNLFSAINGWKKYGGQIHMSMAEPAFSLDVESLKFYLENSTGKPIQYILSPIIYKKQENEENGQPGKWKQVTAIAGFCGFLSPMEDEVIELEVPWNGSFEPEGPGTYKLEIQIMPEPDMRFIITDIFELK